MTNKQKLATANLAFFEAALWEPVLGTQGLLRFLPDGRYEILPVPIICLMELTHWIRVGVQIGFFNERQVADVLLSGLSRIREGWSNLQRRGAVALVQKWCDFIVQKGENIDVDIGRFLQPSERKGLWGEIQGADFQNFLLLSSEIISDMDVINFLQAVAWSPDAKWSQFMNEGGYWRDSNGFWKIIDYLENLTQLMSYDFPIDSEQSRKSKEQLAQAIRGFQSKRLGLDAFPESVGRYFQFAGALLPYRIWEENGEQLVRGFVFQPLARLITAWGRPADNGELDRWWQQFLGSANRGRSVRARPDLERQY
jgi:hypothetical protein